MKLTILSIGIALFLLGCNNYNQTSKEPKNKIPFENSLLEANVILPEITNGQEQGMMIGNGDMYGLIWERDTNIQIRITKNDIWDARINTSEDDPLPKVDIVNGTVSGAIGAPPSYDHPYPQPKIAATLIIESLENKNMNGYLDISKGLATVKSNEKVFAKFRILHDHNVLLIDCPHPIKILSEGERGSTDGVDWVKATLPGDIDYKGMSHAIAIASKGNLKAISLVTSFDIKTGDVVAQAIAKTKKAIAQKEQDLIKAHEEAWNQYWSRSGIELEDKVMERWWYRMLYFAKTVCKPGAAPVALMPPLATDVTPWHADFHHNYNAWQAFWSLPASNHSELTDPWISYNNSMIPRFKFLAKSTYGIDGLHVPISSFLHEPDPANCKSNNKRQMSMNPWGLTIGLQAMTLQSMWQKYLYDQDLDYMREKIYPFAKEVAIFYTSFMAKCGKDENGKILLGPSYSPEHGDWGIYNCPFDIAYVHYAFDAFIQAAEDLGRDNELKEKCLKYRALLGPYPMATNQDGQTIVVDWKDGEQVKNHNITVPAVPVFPADQVTWFSAESEKELFKNTIKATNFNGVNSHVMFNIAKARLSMLEGYTDAKEWFASRELSNGFFLWKGCKHGTYMQEMIGVSGLINEFLLQSVDNKIRLFPCWPKNKNAKFNDLRAQGGFIVSAEFKNERVVSATIESVSNKKLQIISPWDTIYVNGEKAVIELNGLVILDTKPGQIFKLTETK